MTQQITDLVDQIDTAMTTLADLMAEPGDVDFHAVRADFIRLEKTMNAKAYVDASFAWLVERSDAGRLVGSSRPIDFLIKALGLSWQDAVDRVGRGENLFTTPVTPPMPAPEPEAGENTEDMAERERHLREEEQRRREQDELAQRRAREQARKVAAEKQKIIRQELRNLNQHSSPSHAVLQADALKEAEHRSPEDLRVWLRRRVANANAAGTQPDGTKDRLAGHKRRSLRLGQQDVDGNVAISGSLPANIAAMLTAALAPGLRPGANTSVPEEKDKRTRAQRAVDQLAALLSHQLATDAGTQRQGVGSVVVSMTTRDVEEMTADSRFLTNTGHLLTPLDILTLGAAAYDLGILHDEQGQPLALGRTKRTATFYQRLALFAYEGLCACGNCDGAMIHAHVHHIHAWSQGGMTDLEHLTLECPPHHADNNDQRDGAGGMGHMVKDPETGRAGWQPPGGGPIQFNDTELQGYSAGAKIRARSKPPGTDMPLPDNYPEPEATGLFDLPSTG